MFTTHYEKLADVLVAHSIRVTRGDVVAVDAYEIPEDFLVILIRRIRKAGGQPLIQLHHGRITREIARDVSAAHGKLICDVELARFKKCDCYIGIRGGANSLELSDVPAKSLQTFQKALRPAVNYRVNKTRWVVLRWPSPSMAQSAMMSTEGFAEYYFDVCTLNYQAMSKAAAKLQRLMARTDKVEIRGPQGTNLSFSIKGIGAIACTGEYNIPDGEVFSCPIKDSVEGTIAYNAPSIYSGTKYENVKFTFKRGKIVDASGTPAAMLQKTLNSDAGARYIGEFAIGFNPKIMKPMGDILFDEKIAGSLHFTPGQAYGTAGNGNKSVVHWDLVLIQRKEYGGGEIWFDGECIRRNGIFLPKELRALNY